MKLKGKIKVCSIDSKGKEQVMYDVENAVTEFFEDVVATYGLETFFTYANPIPAGQTNIFFGSPSYSSNNWSKNYAQYPNENLIVFFLNLTPEEKASLTKKSTLLPVYNSTFDIDSEKIVGYATATVSASNSKQGYMQALTGVNLVNHRKHAVKFKWDAGVMSGEYNTIVVGINPMSNKYAGIMLTRAITTENAINGDLTGQSYYLRPNVKSEDGSVVYTSENELLLGGADDIQKARKVLNLVTGEVTALESTDIRYDVQLYSNSPSIVIGNNFYYKGASSLFKADITNNFSSNTWVSASYNNHLSLFTYNGCIYCQYSNSYFKAYNSDLQAVSSADLYIANMNFPAGLLTYFQSTSYTANIFNYGENFILSTSGCTLIFSDITDIAGSIIQILPFANCFETFVVNGEPIIISNQGYNNNYKLSPYGYAQYPNASGNGITIYKNGLNILKASMCGNLFSFKVFDEQQTVPLGDTTLEYYYTFEQ